MYANGTGVPQDYVQSHLWYSLAATRLSSGMERQLAVEGRDRVSAKMTPAQLAEAHKLGSVEIHRELMTAATRWIMARKLLSVLSARIAMRLNSLSLQKKFSMRWRHL